jgi:diguanylate cyclase (GGDEF)-like protein
MFIWIPFIVSYAISCIIGRGELSIKYAICTSYLIFYIYTQLTSQSLGTFTYIFPMMCALLVYNDLSITDFTCGCALIFNILLIVYKAISGELEGQTQLITFYEIEVACLMLCTVFLHKTTILLRYSNNKLNQLNEEVSTDSLTGVGNRWALDKFLVDKFKEKDESISLAVIDADAFKSINDNYGHKFGDLVLRKISGTLKDVTHAYEETQVIRTGGDEFLIISALLSRDELYKVCTKICDKLNDTYLQYGDKKVKFSVSIGVANSIIDDKHTYKDLFDEADRLLYTVKVNGKNSAAKSDKTVENFDELNKEESNQTQTEEEIQLKPEESKEEPLDYSI